MTRPYHPALQGFQKGEKGHLLEIIHRQPAPPIEGHSPFVGQIMSESLYLCPQIQQLVPIPLWISFASSSLGH